jgi:hypothetical protein
VLAIVLDYPLAVALRWLLIGLALPWLLVAVGGVVVLVAWLWREILARVEVRARYDIDGDGYVGRPPDIRLIPHRQATPTLRVADDVHGYEAGDFAHMVRHAYRHGYTARAFLGRRLPSGRVLANYQTDVQPFLRALEATGYIHGRGPRSAGQLLGSEEECLEAFGL